MGVFLYVQWLHAHRSPSVGVGVGAGDGVRHTLQFRAVPIFQRVQAGQAQCPPTGCPAPTLDPLVVVAGRVRGNVAAVGAVGAGLMRGSVAARFSNFRLAMVCAAADRARIDARPFGA